MCKDNRCHSPYEDTNPFTMTNPTHSPGSTPSAALRSLELREAPPEQQTAFWAWVASMRPDVDQELGVSSDPSVLSFTRWLENQATSSPLSGKTVR